MRGNQLDEAGLSTAWMRWQDLRDQAERDRLICHYLPLVEFLAAGAAARVVPSARPDLIGFGVLGLIDALHKFDPERGCRFETYGSRRIRGAMADGIRSLQWLPRRAAQRASKIIESIVPVDFASAVDARGMTLADSLVDHTNGGFETLELGADHEEVAAAARLLPERERHVVEAYYYEGRSLVQIGATLGVSESRACQIHRNALRLLRRRLLDGRCSA